MKNIFCLVAFVTLLVTVDAYAENNSTKKLYRGVVNVITAPIEIPKQSRAYWVEGAQKTDHILVWIGSGAVWGMIQGVKRAGSGLWDVFSFPFARPEEYKPLLEPDFVFEEWPRNPVSGR